MPRFNKARRAIRDVTTEDVEDDMIESVTVSMSPTPIVPVRKGTEMNICWDCTVIVNQTKLAGWLIF